MSRDKIKQVAIEHYNEFGYEGAKLSKIAEEVGIRKQSLAYHFANKKSLFQEVLKEAIEAEIHFIEQYFREYAELPLDDLLYQFLTKRKERFLSNASTRFVLKITFLIPDEIIDEVHANQQAYMQALKSAVENSFAKETFRKSTSECAEGYITLLDGLEVQLVYEEQKASYERVQRVIWDIFWTGIQNKLYII